MSGSGKLSGRSNGLTGTVSVTAISFSSLCPSFSNAGSGMSAWVAQA